MASPSQKEQSYVFGTDFFDNSHPATPHAATTASRDDNPLHDAQPQNPLEAPSPELSPQYRSSMYDMSAGDAESHSSACSTTPMAKESSSEPAFSLDEMEAPTTAQAYWAAEAHINTARQGLFGDLRRRARDVYGPTAPFCKEHIWGSKPLWYTHTEAPNCQNREPFRVLIRRTHWPRTVILYLAFTTMPVLSTVANRRLGHWAMLMCYWLPWAATMVVILLCSFSNPGIVPRRLVKETIQDTGDVIVVRVPAPNAEKVLEKLQETVVVEGQVLGSQASDSKRGSAGSVRKGAPPSAPPTNAAMETLRRARAERLLSTGDDGRAEMPSGVSQLTADDEAQRQEDAEDAARQQAFTFPPTSARTDAAHAAPHALRQELSLSMSTSALQTADKKTHSSSSRPRLATFADAAAEPPSPSNRRASSARRLSTSTRTQDQQRRCSMAASSLLSQRSAATSNNRYFINETGMMTSEIPPMSEAELETPHIEIPFRLCRTCHVFRGPRTHHCHKCGNCVDELDHHCPWTNSCIGRHNYSYFLLALLFIHITMLYIVFNNVYLTFMYLNDHVHNNYADYLAETLYLPPIIYAAAFVVGFYFSGLGLSHLYMNIKGITTFEMLKYVFTDSPYYNGVNPWDRGVWHNCVDRLCGLNTIQWLDSRYYYPVTVAFILEEKLLDWRLALPEAERALVEAEEARRRKQMVQEREQQTRELLELQ